MNVLPDDLRLNIAEYTPIARNANRLSSIGVNDRELLYRIRQYDPSFDYNRWKLLIGRKRSLSDQYRDSLSMQLISLVDQYKRDTGIDVQIFIHRNNPSFYDAKSTSLPDLVSLISQSLNIPVNNVRITERDNKYLLIIYDGNYTFTDNKSVEAFMHPYTSQERSADTTLNNPCMEKEWEEYYINTRKFEDIVLAGSIPNTLEEYLSFIVQRDRQRNVIVQDTIFPLYEFLMNQPFQVEYGVNGEFDSISFIFPIRYNILSGQIISLLPIELRNNVSVYESPEQQMYYIVIIFNNEIDASNTFSSLQKIHTFFYPLRYQSCK